MSKQPRTLYEQLRDEANQQKRKEVSTAKSVVQWTVIALAVVIVTAVLPGSRGEEEHGTYDRTLLGTTWSLESVVAEYSFPVPKDQAELNRQRDSAASEAVVVFKETEVSEAMISSRLHSARTTMGTDYASWFSAHSGKIMSLCTSDRIVDARNDSTYGQAALIMGRNGSMSMVSTASLTPLSRKQDEVSALAAQAPPVRRTQLADLLRSIPLSTLQYDASSSARERDQAKNGVATTQEIVRRGSVVVRTGQRVDNATLARLAAYRNAQYLRSGVRYSVFAILGSLGHALLIIGFVVLYLYFLRPHSFANIGQLGTLVGLPVLSAVMGWLSIQYDAVLPMEYIIVVPAMAMVITILYEARTAIFMTVVMSIAVGAARGDDYGVMLVLLVGGMLGVYSARNIHSRTQIFTSIVAIFIGLVVAVVAVDMERSAPIQWMWPKIVVAAANAVVSPLLTFGIILIFERVFNVATDLRLEEFNNLNHELLRKLNERAPGTYQHTLAVARLSEAAAQAIGANVLLTRIGAYFHDIGKIEKSEYFVENQIGIENKHDKLPPRKSVSIIRQHVQDGLELAATYHLPSRITQFIPMHHGTILIKHFYALAVEASQESETIQVLEDDFRYPGPKPTSKETGIVMLADAVEAVSRLVDTTQKKAIESAIDAILVDRVVDGQLSDTPLTMHDLELIKEAFVRNILGTTHQRVQYKEVQPKTTGS